MKNKPSIVLLIAVPMLWCLVLTTPGQAAILNVPEIFQEQTNWCWAGSSEAVIEYYGAPVDQCTIANWARAQNSWGAADCCLPGDAGGPVCNQANGMFGSAGSLQSILINWGIPNADYGRELTQAEIQTGIDAHQAFVIRWGWTSGGGHFLVGRGYVGSTVHYMDPWFGNGYASAAYSWVVSGGTHQWTHSLQVTLVDSEPPVITCPVSITLECNSTGGVPGDDPGVLAFLAAAAATDNSDPDPDIIDDAPAFFPVGTTTVTFTATDAFGNTSSCSADVAVVDTTPPDITCPASITVECSAFCGVPADDAQLVDFFDTFEATDVCCADPELDLDNPDCFPMGETIVHFTATDCSGNTAMCSAKVTVVDTTPPEIDVVLNRDVLWPPNHKMAEITADVTVTDICCATPTFVLVSITSDEPDDGLGDGHTSPDIDGANYGMPDVAFQLRSERMGGEDGRVYTIVYTAEDCVGNTADATVYVRVPHDHAGWAFASMGFEAGGLGFDPALDRFVLIVPSRPASYATDGAGNQVLIAPAFDATALDITRTYVGNLLGVVLPNESLVIDNNADGLEDLALYYPAELVNDIMGLQTISDVEIALGDSWGAIGLHYVSADGIDYLVPNIFQLGEPVPIVPPIEIRRTDDPGTGGEPEPEIFETPTVTALLDVHPNPFNPSTTIPFHLVTQERVSLRIYDAQGKLVRTLVDEVLPAGATEVVWDGRDNSGSQVGTGVYFIRFVAGRDIMTKKVVMIK